MRLKLFSVFLFFPMLTGCTIVAVGGAIATTAIILDSRDVSSQMDDSGMRLRVTSALQQDASLSDQRIRAIPYNGDLLLIGQVNNEASKRQAEQLAREHGQPLNLFNELKIADTASVSDRSRDTWITTRVKSLLLRGGDHDMSGIKVVTENREVYLLGLVDDAAAQNAVEIARHVRGVQRVINVLSIQ